MKITQRAAARALDLSKNTVLNYENGKRCDWPDDVEVPKHVLLACSALEAGLPPIN